MLCLFNGSWSSSYKDLMHVTGLFGRGLGSREVEVEGQALKTSRVRWKSSGDKERRIFHLALEAFKTNLDKA